MEKKRSLTVFTPTFNRLHTLRRTFMSMCRQTCKDFEWMIIDDGSSDGTRDWVESLGNKIIKTGQRFDWMGRRIEGDDENNFVIEIKDVAGSSLIVKYLYKPNGGLYTGYNVAYQCAESKLCVAVDSDDYLPDNAVELILSKWNLHLSDKYCGIVGLDFDVRTNEPIGGMFPEELSEIYLHEIDTKQIHGGDTKVVLRTDMVRNVAPMIGFEGEKNFNPVYMILQVCDQLPLLVLNDNLCWVEYQEGGDSMSKAIWKQYINSPRSFAKMRLQEMTLVHNTWKDRFRSAVHYVSSCIIAKDGKWLKKSTNIGLTILAAPFGVLMYCLIKYKNKV